MVDVCNKRCIHDFCARHLNFNLEGSKTPLYCKEHAGGDMVNIRKRSCSHVFCAKKPCFKTNGSPAALYCRQHANDGMVRIGTRVCLHERCSKQPAWSVPSDRTPFACSSHVGDIVGGPVINFRPRCRVVDCRNLTRWGLDGKQPTHCSDHGPLTDGFVCTGETDRRNKHPRTPSCRDAREPSLRVETKLFVLMNFGWKVLLLHLHLGS